MGLETVNTYGHCAGAVEAPFDVSTGFYDFGMSQIYYVPIYIYIYIFFTTGQNLIVSLKCVFITTTHSMYHYISSLAQDVNASRT